jgi:hypothetical protein
MNCSSSRRPRAADCGLLGRGAERLAADQGIDRRAHTVRALEIDLAAIFAGNGSERETGLRREVRADLAAPITRSTNGAAALFRESVGSDSK